VGDERIRERRRLLDAIGGQRDHRRRLEDTDPRGRRGQKVRKPGRDHDQEPGRRREAEVEAQRQEPERHPEHDPGEGCQEERQQPEARVAQHDHALREVADRGLDPPRREEGQAGKRRQEDTDGAFPVDAQDDDGGSDRKRENDRQGARGPDPGHLGEPRDHDEEEQEQGEDVEDALEDDGPGRLHPRRASERAQGDDPGGVSGPEREDAVQELAEDECLGRWPDARARLRREHVPPAEHSNEEPEGEQREGGQQVPVVAVVKGAGELGELDVPDGEVSEAERERGC
jgi:hypothetical protein